MLNHPVLGNAKLIKIYQQKWVSQHQISVFKKAFRKVLVRIRQQEAVLSEGDNLSDCAQRPKI